MGSTGTRTEQFSLKGPIAATNCCVPLLKHPVVLLFLSYIVVLSSHFCLVYVRPSHARVFLVQATKNPVYEQ